MGITDRRVIDFIVVRAALETKAGCLHAKYVYWSS